MQKIGLSILFLVCVLLVVLHTRTLNSMQRLEDKIERLDKTARSRAPAAESATDDEFPPSEPRVPKKPATALAPPPPPTEVPVEIVPSVESSGILTNPGRRPRPRERAKALPDVTGLTAEQKRGIDELLEARRNELRALDGDLAVRRLEIERRYDAAQRQWLSAEQQKAFDESRRAPRPDGPVTPSAAQYIAQDPAPYDIEVEWNGTWWPARTLQKRSDLTLIHFVGHGEDWDEWAPAERVRPKQ